MECGWPEPVSLCDGAGLPVFCSHTTLYTFEINIAMISIIHHFPTGCAVVCAEERTVPEHILERNKCVM